MELEIKDYVYIAKYESTAYKHNNERHFEAHAYKSIGKAIADAEAEILAQQGKNEGFVGVEIKGSGSHGVTIYPKYEGTKYNNKTGCWERSTKEGQWRWVIITLTQII